MTDAPETPWPVGTLVQERSPDAFERLRMVVGYKPDGRCMTVSVRKPPWEKGDTGKIRVDCVDRFRPADNSVQALEAAR